MKKVTMFLVVLMGLALVPMVFGEDVPEKTDTPVAPKPRVDFYGTVKTFNAETRELVIVVRKNDKTLTLDKEAKILKGKDFTEEGTVEELKEGVWVNGFLAVDDKGEKTTTIKELRLAPPREPRKEPRAERPEKMKLGAPEEAPAK